MPPCKVTIAIPTRNRAGYLRLSLASALAQTYENLEVVVSNNACSDDTASVLDSIRDPRLRVLYQPTLLGMMQNWNACLRAATGKYFILLSDDDILEPAAIAEMVEAYEESERQGDEIGFVYCGGVVIDQDGRTLASGTEAPAVESAPEIITAFFSGMRKTWACAILFRTVDLAPGYDESLSLMSDAAQWIRIVASYGSARFLNRKLTRYRMHMNATLQTRIANWHQEINVVGEFAIEELQKRGFASDDLSRAIRRAVRKTNIGLTADFINQALRYRKTRALKEYWVYRGMFMSGWGTLVLARGLVLLMMPDSLRKWIHR
jgi:glycosyltransferase involved in cell wall biosynthesis